MTLIGTQLGNYRIESLIGKGGMAEVYRATDQNLGRPVAIKVLSAAIAAQAGFTDRFRQEARMLASLRNPHIVQVYDFGEQNGLTYMVQELLTGQTLDDRLEALAASGQSMGRDEVLTIVRQIASALDAAHAAGIIHRDIKPSNVIWNAAGQLVLTDFGIAKNILAAGGHTQTGMVLGTPDYLSPEQARGITALTPASDMYSLGVLVYQMLTSSLPFQGTTPIGVVMAHLQDPPPPIRTRRPDVLPAVEAAVMKALAKQPEDRYPSAGAFVQALDTAWNARPAAAATVVQPPVDVHNQQTSVWQGAPRRQPAPPAQQTAPATSPGTVAAPVLPPPAQQSGSYAAPAAPRRRSCLPGLLVLLVLGLLGIGGLVYGARLAGGDSADPTSAPVVGATTAPTEAEAPTETPAPTATEAPTETPAPTATEAPTETPAQLLPTPLPPVGPGTLVPLPGPGTDPFGSLQSTMATAAENGQLGKKPQELFQLLDQARQSLAVGDTSQAGRSLGELRNTVLHDKDIDKGVANNIIGAIDALAHQYSLSLSEETNNGGNNGKGKGKGKN